MQGKIFVSAAVLSHTTSLTILFVPFSGIVMILTETEITEGGAVVEAGTGMAETGIARGAEIGIIAIEVEAAV